MELWAEAEIFLKLRDTVSLSVSLHRFSHTASHSGLKGPSVAIIETK